MAESANDLEMAEQLQQHPEVELLMQISGSLVLSLFVGSAIMWFYAIRRLRRGEAILRVEPWTPRVWGLLDLILIVGLVIVGQAVSIKLWAMNSGVEIRELRDESDFPLSAMAAVSLSYLVVMLISALWLIVRYGASMAHIGLNSRKLTSNLAVGAGAALLSLPVVYAIMALINFSFSEQYDHPLLDRMIDEGSVSAFLLATFCAVAAAPITEEFLFRVMLQGWLQSIPWSVRDLHWLTGATARQRGIELSDNILGATPLARIVDDDESGVSMAAFSANPNTPPGHEVSLITDAPVVTVRDDFRTAATIAERSPPLWPVFVSGTLFGLAHWGYGLSFIPLIILGIILGLLYRATHSIWPSFVVHFVLNSISMVGLGINMLVQTLLK